MQYKDAMQQLQGIVRRVESAEIDVDELASALRDANKLVALCRHKLRDAEDEVEKALEDLRCAGDADGEGEAEPLTSLYEDEEL